MASFFLVLGTLGAAALICDRLLWLLRAPVRPLPVQEWLSRGGWDAVRREAERLPNGPSGRVIRAASEAASSGRDAVARAVHRAVLEQSPSEWARLEWLWLWAHLVLLIGVISIVPQLAASLRGPAVTGSKAALDLIPLWWGAGLAAACAGAHHLFAKRAAARLAQLDRSALTWVDLSGGSAEQPSAKASAAR